MKDNMKELLPVVDEAGRVVASATRGQCHDGKSRLLHPVVHLHVYDASGRLFLQLRPLWKDIQPGKWDTAVGGHVDYGEEVETALRREAFEELGLTDFTPRFMGSYVFECARERELVYAYSAQVDAPPAPSDETAGGRFFSPEELRAHLGQEFFTPNFEGEYFRLLCPKEPLL